MTFPLTTAQAAQSLGCATSTVLHMIQRGQLPATKNGKAWAIDADAVEAMVDAGYSPEKARSDNGKLAARKRMKPETVRRNLFRQHNREVGL